MKGWVKLALKKLLEGDTPYCDHTVGIFHDYSDTDLVLVSELTVDPEKRWSLYYVGDVSFFEYCPDCGDKLPYKEKYKDAIEMVQMPR